ncbi:MAG: SGNH/GDSL hydrolase family protein [Myxococcota bacterium]
MRTRQTANGSNHTRLAATTWIRGPLFVLLCGFAPLACGDEGQDNAAEPDSATPPNSNANPDPSPNPNPSPNANPNPNPIASGSRILPLGDSITEGVPHHYRFALSQRLQTAGVSFDFVGSVNSDAANYGTGWDQDHEGHDGWGTVDVIAELPTWLNGYDADVALVHLGTNDVLAVAANEFTWADSIGNLGAIIDALRQDNPAIQIYLAQILPMLEEGTPDPGVAEWNQRVATLAGQRTTAASPITVVDMNTGFGAGDLEGDGIHPNQAGGEKMAGVWATALLAGLGAQ